jgi:hypothetical protein
MQYHRGMTIRRFNPSASVRAIIGLAAVSLFVGAAGCSACDGTRFDAHDGLGRFDVPGLGPSVTLVIPDITTQGASAQRARDIFVYEGDREIARSSEVYEGQAVRFTTGGRRYRVEVMRYIEHLLSDDEAQLCLVAE